MMEKSITAVKYMIDVWDKVTNESWRNEPDHVQAKFLDAETECYLAEQKQKLIDHIFKSACNYELADPSRKGGKEDFKKCMESIPNDLFNDFIDTLQRVAEKSGERGFFLPH